MKVFMCAAYLHHPDLADRQIMSVVSPEVDGYAPCGTPYGAESGHLYRNIPKALRYMYSAPYEVYEIKDYEAKYYTLVRIAAGQDIGTLTAANPSTILLLGQRLGAHTEAIIRDVRDGTIAMESRIDPAIAAIVRAQLQPDPERAKQLEAATRATGALRMDTTWPNLSLITCWKGGTVGVYLGRFRDHFRGPVSVRDLGYLATELRGSLPMTDIGDSGPLAITGNVFEFFPVDANRAPEPQELLTLDQLEVGNRYFVYITTPSGLYRYDMNDIVEVTGQLGRTPLIRFVQKGKGVLSFTGEKLYETQVLGAVSAAFDRLDRPYEFIAAVGEFVGGQNPQPRLVFLVEFPAGLPGGDAQALAGRLDDELGRQNAEYRTKRESLRYGAPVLRIVRPGEFDAYRRRQVEAGRADGQFKILRLTSDASFAAQFAYDRDVDEASERNPHG
jgi:hypothetical protein